MSTPVPPPTELSAPEQHLAAWIETGGIKLTVHSVKSEGKTSSGFVESVVEQEFAVGFRLGMNAPEQDIYATGKVDGTKFHSRCFPREHPTFAAAEDDKVREQQFTGATTGETKQRQLEFGPIDFTANAIDATHDQSTAGELGTISLTIGYGKRKLDTSHGTMIDQDPGEAKVVLLKAEEGGPTERVRLGRTSKKTKSSHYHFTYAKGDARVIAEFRFFYRSRASLEAMGVPLTNPSGQPEGVTSSATLTASQPSQQIKRPAEEAAKESSRSPEKKSKKRKHIKKEKQPLSKSDDVSRIATEPPEQCDSKVLLSAALAPNSAPAKLLA